MNRSKGPEKEKALVIHSLRHGESSRIVTLFSESKGRVSVIAKGARKSKSGSAIGVIDPPSLIEAMVYFKSTRSVQTLGAVSLLDGFRKVKADLTLTAYASVILQYLYRGFLDGDPNQEAFNLSISSLHELEKGLVHPRLILWRFQMGLSQAIGFGFDPMTCPVCGKSPADISLKNSLMLDAGGIGCHSCNVLGEKTLILSGESVRIIRRLGNGNLAGLQNLRISSASKSELTKVLEKYLRFHQPSLGGLSSLEMLNQLESM